MATNAKLQQLISEKKYDAAILLLSLQTPDNDTDRDKKASNMSYVYYLMRKFEDAKRVILEVLARPDREMWPRLYYRLAKANEGLLDYDAMNAAYDIMYSALPEEEKDKSLPHMQDYYNQNVLLMRQWLISQGGYVNNIQVEYYDVDYRGVTVSATIKPGEPIIKVPRSCVFSVLEAKKHNKYLMEIKAGGVTVTADHTFLALDMIYTKKNGGPIMPYIKCLPKYFDNVPINFTIDELIYLEGSYTIAKIIQKLLFLKIDYDKICEAYPNRQCPFSFNEFMWGRTAVITRVYKIMYNGQDDNVMAPFADMANHEIPPNTKWGFDNASDMFVVEAENHLYRGDVLYETYGHKCNYRYFVNYGFTVNNNRDEEVGLVMNDHAYMVYRFITQKLMQYPDKTTTIREIFTNDLANFIDSKLLEMVITEHGTYQIGYTYNDTAKKLFKQMRDGQDEPTNLEQEVLILFQILNKVNRTLLDFPTSAEDDETLLKNYEYSFNIRNTIVVRKGEKKVLHFWKRLCELCLDALQSSEKTPFKKVNKKMIKWEQFNTFTPYIKQLEQLHTAKVK